MHVLRMAFAHSDDFIIEGATARRASREVNKQKVSLGEGRIFARLVRDTKNTRHRVKDSNGDPEGFALLTAHCDVGFRLAFP